MARPARRAQLTAIAARLKSVATYVVLVVLAVMICAEMVLWTHDKLQEPGPESIKADDFTTRFPVPYVMFHAQPNASVHIDRRQGRGGERSFVETNSSGFRYAADLSRVKPAGEKRIFALGGSVLFNGLSNETTITGALERILNENREKEVIKVINSAIVSGDSDQELSVLVHQIADRSPDLVLVFDGFNELWTRLYYEPRVGYPYNWSSFENAHSNNQMIREALNDLNPLDYLLAMSKVATMINPSWELENRIIRSFREAAEPETLPRGMSDAVIHQIIVRWMNNWIKMHRFADTLDAKMVGILQPINPRGKEDRIVARFYQLANKQIDLLRSHGYPFFSFDGVLDQYPEHFRDIVHTWDDAHPIYARLIRDLLVDQGHLADMGKQPSPKAGGQHDEAQHDEAQHDEAQHDEAQHDEAPGAGPTR